MPPLLRVGRRSGFCFDERLVQATLPAIGHITVNDPALGGFVEGGCEFDKLLTRDSRLPSGEGGTKLFLFGLKPGDDTGVDFASAHALAGALCCRFGISHK